MTDMFTPQQRSGKAASIRHILDADTVMAAATMWLPDGAAETDNAGFLASTAWLPGAPVEIAAAAPVVTLTPPPGVARVGTEILVNTATANGQNNAQITTLSNGGFVVIWRDASAGVGGAGGDTSGTAIKAQVFGPAGFAATEQTALSLKGGVTIADADADAGDILIATLAVTYGVLDLTAGTSGATIVSGNGTSSVVVSGTLAQLDALLRTDAASTITYTPNTDAPPASAALTVSVEDNSAEVGSANADIAITSVNDAPSGTDNTIGLQRDGSHTFAQAEFGFSDVDGNNFLSVIITTLPTAGTLTFAGWEVVQGMAIPRSDIPNLVYTPAAGQSGVGYGSFTFQVMDNGGTANGGVNMDPDPKTMTFDVVAPVNQAPVIANLQGDVSTQTEGVGGTIFVDVGRNAVVSDADSANFAGGSLTVSVTNHNGADAIGIFGDGNIVRNTTTGAVSIGGVMIGTATGGAYAAPRTDTLTIEFNANATPALVQALVRNLFVQDQRIEPVGGTREITLTLTDGDGGVSTYNTSLIVNAVNDEPGGTDKTITSPEDMPHTFTVADFGFRDNADDGDFGLSEGQTLAGVIITTLPLAGALTLDGVAVTAGQYVLTADFPKLLFTPAANANGAGYASFTFQVVDSGPTGGLDQNTDQTPNTITFDITPVNDAPVSTGFDNVTFTEGQTHVQLDTGFDLVLTDVDSPDFDGGSLTIRVSGNKVDTEDAIGFLWGGMSFLAFNGNVITYWGVPFATVTAGGAGQDRVVTFNANATVEAVQTLMRNVTYTNVNQNDPSTETRTISYTLTDGDGGTLELTSTVTVIGVNDAPSTSVPGATQNGVEDSDLVFSTANGNALSVADPEHDAVTVTLSVTNGVLTLSGTSGLSFSAGDGTGDRTMTFSGTAAAINSALDGLIYRGDLNYNGADTLQIGVDDGAASAAGSVAIDLAADGVITGDGGDNALTGTQQADYFDLSQGGDDNVQGMAGDDGFYFGGAYDHNDVVDGGTGGRDQIGLQGDYSAGVTLGSLVDVELVVLLAGDDARFGGATGTDLAYNITADANTIVSNNRLIIQANLLRAGESLTFDGSASSIDFLIYGGLGTDILTGGSGNDGFFFGQGRFGANDIVDGGAGNMDQLGLQGDFTGANAISFGAGQLLGIEYLVLLSAGDDRFGAFGGVVDYDLTMHDGNVAAGATMIVSATTLRVGEDMRFDGSAETDGRFEIYAGSGNDIISGGAGDDLIFGGGRGDTLTGGGGNDIFAYRSVTDSNSTERDGIQDFSLGDRIDLSRIDANINLGGKQSFDFVGTNAFTGTAGELRYENISLGGPIYLVQGDVNGDGISDIEIVLVMTDRNALTAADFIGVNAPAPGAEPLVGPDKAAALALFADDGAGAELVLDPMLSAGASDGQGAGALVRAGLSDGVAVDPMALPELVFIGTDYALALTNPGGDLLL